MTQDILSLRHHLMNWLFTPLFVLWIFSTATGYMETVSFANKPYDQALAERAQSLAAHMELGSSRPRLDQIPPALAGNATGTGDRVFFMISGPDGRQLAGNAPLPRPPAFLLKKKDPVFSDAELKGQKIRMVTLQYATGAGPEDAVLLQMAETVGKRQALARGILGNIVIPQMLLIVMAGFAVWYALKRGLAPLEHLRAGVAKRSREDLSPLDEAKAPDEVRPLISAVNSLMERLKQAMEAHKRFVADAAHQLRTPFAGLKTQAELALRESDPETVRHNLRQILTSAERCSHLVNQLLSLARNEPGTHTYSSFAPLDLNRVAQKCAIHWVPEALKKGIDLGFEGGPQTVPVKGDALGLNEMMCNLLDNAIRYTQEGGKVTVRVSYEDGGGVLRVEDNGPGIAPEHRERVFERFYRILGSGQEGSGLGLAIVREVVRLHNAEITLGEGSGGRGTLVTVRFPHHAAI
jgi:two-component system sensor histidine kinase TctE